MILALALSLAVGAPGAQDSSAEVGLRWGRVACVGPSESLAVETAGGTTHLDPGLGPGERLELVVPFAFPSVLCAAPPADPLRAGDAAGEASARWSGWLPAGQAPPVPLGLRARPRPPYGGEPPRAGAVELLLAAAGALGVLACRRRPLAALLVGAGATLALAGWLRRRDPPGPQACQRVLEGELGTRTWWCVDVGSWLALEAESALALRPHPAGRRVELEPARAAGGSWRWTARVERGWLDAARPCEPGLRALAPTCNGWGPIARAWTRPAGGGAWLDHGAWELGEPLGPGVPGTPPGWLASGAPPGRGVLVARLGPGAWSGSPTLVEGVVWLRFAGFERPESH